MDAFMGILLVIIGMLGAGGLWVIVALAKIRRYMKLQIDMQQRIINYCAEQKFSTTIPVVAVERLVRYISHPDPSLDVGAIVAQENCNQMTFSIEKPEQKCT